MKRFSIIIPLYNINIEYLEECLESCIKQDYNDYEIIVVDDGSEINYNSLLSKFKSKIKYIRTDNFGVSHARNIGIKNSIGKYLLFLDSDDYLPTNCLKEYANVINEQKFDIVIAKTYIIENNISINHCRKNNSFKITNKEELHRAVMFNNDPNFSCVDTVWAKLYSKEFLEKNSLFFNEKLKNCEDVIFNYEAYHKAENIYYLNLPTYYYRVNNYSACHSFQSGMLDISLMFLKEQKKLIEKLNVSDKYFPQYVFRIVIRLFRKYYKYIVNEPDFEQKLLRLLNEPIILENLGQLDRNVLDIYKKELIGILQEKNTFKIQDYINNVCKKELLKK